MKKKSSKNADSTAVIIQIQEQLAALDQKFDAFINKSLTDIAGVLAAQKASTSRPVQAPPSAPILQPQLSNGRPKFAIVCYQCGKDSELPFKPAHGRPVYCPECFAIRKAGNAPKTNNEIKPPAPVQTTVAVRMAEPAVAKVQKKVLVKKVVKKTIAKKVAKKSARKKEK